MLALHITITTQQYIHVLLAIMPVLIVLSQAVKFLVLLVRLDSKDISLITLVSVPPVILTMDSNQDAKHVLMSTLTVFLALIPLTLYNQLLSTKTSSIRQPGPLTFCQTLLRSPV